MVCVLKIHFFSDIENSIFYFIKFLYFQIICLLVGTSQTESVDHHEEGPRRYFCSWCQRTKLWPHTLAGDNEVILLFN